MKRKMKAAGSKRIAGKVIVRTLTHYYVGEVESCAGMWLLLRRASWVADTGRWHDALANGNLSEVEPYPDEVWVRLDNVVDVSPWKHDLPGQPK